MLRFYVLFAIALTFGGSANAGPPEEVIFGGDVAYPPFEWDDNGTSTGFNIDLENALAEIGQVRAKHRLGPWSEIVRALENGEVDIVPMFVSEEREKIFRFSSAFHYVSHAIYIKRPAEPVVSVQELTGKSVAVERMSYAHIQLQLDGVGTRLILTGNTLEALEAVAQDKADYAVLAIPSANRLIKLNELAVRPTGLPFWPRPYAFAVRKDRTDLKAWLDQSLNLAIGTGRYEEVYNRWEDHLVPTGAYLAEYVRTAGLIAVPLFLFTALGFAWAWMLRRTVASRTTQLHEELQRRKAAETQLRHIADYDTLTGLPEYHHFIELADEVFRGTDNETAPVRETVVLRLVEIETIVQTFGYTVGQHYLKEFADRLESFEFEVCGYFAHGVFAIVGRKDAVYDNFEALTQQLDADGLGLYPQVVGGVAYWPNHGDTAAELVRHAETALASSIARKHNWAVYEPSMEPDERDLRLVSEFRKSDGVGLYAVFQPQVDLKSGRIVTAEALVRWNHPDMGFISPGTFIPLLEKAGLVTQVTAWMLGEAARISAALRTQGLSCTISVNVAANDFLATDLPAIIQAVLRRYGAQPCDLKLELTETSVAEDPERVKDILEALSKVGIHASIDDFGTGYSSLSHLSAFPIREIKIDQMFVHNMVHNARNRSIVQSTIAMAHELGLTVVAEGAEDQETIEFLKLAGCDRVQGYVIAKPMGEAEFCEFLSNYSHIG